ncbi:MAG: hypothetical protein J5I92_01600 [Thiogranum sp.]|nr:hypothetical protein [Thiogranum sp.]
MEKEPLMSVTWRGRETIAAVMQLLNQAEQIEILLPANYNHTLFSTFNPDAPPSALEDIDISGGPQLLEEIAAIRGLEELAELAQPLRDAGASVQLVSPPKVIIFREQ